MMSVLIIHLWPHVITVGAIRLEDRFCASKEGAICVRFCSFLCILCLNVSEALMLATCVYRFCSCLCKVCSCISEAFLLTLRTLSLTNNFSSDSKAFLGFVTFSGSSTEVHRAFLFFDAMAWPQSQTDLFMVLHCGHTFLKVS